MSASAWGENGGWWIVDGGTPRNFIHHLRFTIHAAPVGARLPHAT